MNDVVVTAPNYASAQRSSHSLGVTAPVSDPPKSVAALPEGHILQGTVTGQDAKGRLQVRTDFGLLAIQSNQKIAVGSQLMLEVRSVGSRVHVLILQVTPAGQGSAQGTVGGAATTATPARPAATGLTPGPDSISVGQNLRAVLQSPAIGGAGLPPDVTRLAPGANLLLRITAVGVPSPGPAMPAAASLGQAGPAIRPEPSIAQAPARPVTPPVDPAGHSQAPKASAGSGAPPVPGAAPPAPLVTSGQELAATLAKSGLKDVAAAQTAATPRGGAPAPVGQMMQSLAAQPTAGHQTGSAATSAAGPGLSNPAPATQAGALPQQLTGLVTAVSRTGEPIIQTPIGTLSLELRAAIPVGSSLAFQVLRAPAALPSPIAADGPAPWNALSAFLASLDADPALRAMLMQRALPQAGPRLTSGLLLFLNALRGRSIEGWLGALGPSFLQQAKRSGSLDRLRDGFAGLSRLVEGNGGEWRLFLIPFLQGATAQPMRLYLRDNDQDDEENNRQRKPKATRFILDVELSRLGGMQLDGLVRSSSFDLVLRSDQPLSQQARQMVTEIFETANDAAGMTGMIVFQSTKDRQVFEETGDLASHHPTMLA